MSEASDPQPTDPSQSPPNAPVTAQDLADVITEFEEYRERLVNETLETAKRAKLQKSTVMAQLEPELTKIDAVLQNLRLQQAALTD
jgi:hypothetical protein